MRLAELGRITSWAVSIAFLTALSATMGCGSRDPDAGRIVPTFYTPPSPLSPAVPGTVIKTGGIEGAPSGIRVQRIMYHSRTNRGEDIATTGLLATPGGDPPAGGWPLIAFAHGTTGIIPPCAPSIDPFRPAGKSSYHQYYEPWILQGYAVVGADYQGLGAVGPYGFLVGQAEGQQVIDSVRAAKRISSGINDQLLFYGHSQGGNAAGWAAEILPTYAPELTSLGVVLAAPAASLYELIELAYKGGAGATVGYEAVTFLYLAALSYGASYDGLDPNQVLLPPNGPEGLPIFQNVCASTGGGAFLVNEFVGGPDKPGDFFIPLEEYPQPWIDAINLNSLGSRNIDTPILMVQGCKDKTIPISTNMTYFNQRLCPADEVVEFSSYPNADHTSVIDKAQDEMTAWVKRRLAGEPPDSDCAVPPTCP